MKFNLFIAVLLAALIGVMCDPIPYKDCGSTGVVGVFDISECSKLPCTFIKGHNYTMKLIFTPKADTPSANNKLYGIIAGVSVPFPLPQEDACSNGVSCPLKQGTQYTESVTLAVLPVYPEISLYAKFTVVDGNSNTIVCVLFPCKIVSSRAAHQNNNKLEKLLV